MPIMTHTQAIKRDTLKTTKHTVIPLTRYNLRRAFYCTIYQQWVTQDFVQLTLTKG